MSLQPDWVAKQVTTMLNLARTSVNEWTRMWSMACLYNLAEDYCASTTGACPWVQVRPAAVMSVALL
jgi:hypothetical protein